MRTDRVIDKMVNRDQDYYFHYIHIAPEVYNAKFCGCNFKGSKFIGNFSFIDLYECGGSVLFEDCHSEGKVLLGSSNDWDEMNLLKFKSSKLHTIKVEVDVRILEIIDSEIDHLHLSSTLENLIVRNSRIKNLTISSNAKVIGSMLLSGQFSLFQSTFDHLREYYKEVKEGFIVYKRFNLFYPPPNYWEIKEGSIIEEVVDKNEWVECSAGISFTTIPFIDRLSIGLESEGPIWKCLLPWEALPDTVVPIQCRTMNNRAESLGRTRRLHLLHPIGKEEYDV